MINSLGTSLSGLLAASTRIGASAQNIANANTTGSLDESGRQPYRAVTTQNETSANGQGVISTVIPKEKPNVPVFSPSDPDADTQGFVAAPNVNFAEEAVNIKIAEASYKANLAVIETVSDLSEDLLNIFDDEV